MDTIEVATGLDWLSNDLQSYVCFIVWSDVRQSTNGENGCPVDGHEDGHGFWVLETWKKGRELMMSTSRWSVDLFVKIWTWMKWAENETNLLVD
jgi:hypothetical protein